jgi:hypothetical protein
VSRYALRWLLGQAGTELVGTEADHIRRFLATGTEIAGPSE